MAIPDSGGMLHAVYHFPPADHGSPLNIIDPASGSPGGGQVEVSWPALLAAPGAGVVQVTLKETVVVYGGDPYVVVPGGFPVYYTAPDGYVVVSLGFYREFAGVSDTELWVPDMVNSGPAGGKIIFRQLGTPWTPGPDQPTSWTMRLLGTCLPSV